MTLLITEIAIDENGYFAIEIMNTSSEAFNTSERMVTLNTTVENGSYYSLNVELVADLGLPSSLDAGEVVVVGHSSLDAVEYSASSVDSYFAEPSIASVSINYTQFQSFKFDEVGTDGSTELGTDIVYVGNADRSNNTSGSDNLDEFEVISGYMEENLGIVDESPSLVVTTAEDVVDATDGVTSLREAVIFANSAEDADADGDTVDTITFDSSVFTGGTDSIIRLTEGEIEITDSVNIDGDLDDDGVADVTISGDANADDLDANGLTVADGGTGITNIEQSADVLADNSRIFNISDADATTTLDGLTLTGGYTTTDATSASGGAVYSAADLTITDSTISGNATEGRYADGGGVFANGTLSVSGSSVSGNSTAGDFAGGGGIHTNGDLDVTDSTVSGNSTSGASSHGGGLSAQGGAITLTNTTVSGNSTSGSAADGGGVRGSTEVNLINTTVSGNSAEGLGATGGGVDSFGAGGTGISLTNSVIMGNTASENGSDVYQNTDQGAAISYTGGNIVGDTLSDDGTEVTTGITAAEVFAETEENNGVDAGVLADNGGTVQTIALLEDTANPVLDAGDAPDGVTTDANGNSRAVDQTAIDNGGAVDLGAVEVQTVFEDPSLVVTTAEDVVDATDGVTSLREAVNFANSASDADGEGDTVDTITFDASVFTGGTDSIVRLTEGEIEITDAVIIDGDLDDDGVADVMISGDAWGNDLDADGTTVANGGSGITDVENSGAISNVDDNIVIIGDDDNDGITDSLLDDNSRIFNISDEDATTTLDGLTLTGALTLSDDAHGGAVQTAADLTITNSVISGNLVAGQSFGGGIGAVGGSVTDDVADGPTITVSGSTFSDNRAAGGGAIGTEYGSVDLTDTDLSGNVALSTLAQGGAVFTDYGSITMTGGSATDNSAYGFGSDANANGGALATTSGDVTVTDATLSGNLASVGGIDGYDVIGSVDADGGAIFTSGGDVVISGSTFTGNQAEVVNLTGYEDSTTSYSITYVDARGGAVFSTGDTLTVSDSTFTGNVAQAVGNTNDNSVDAEGGAIRGGSVVEITDSTLTDNTSLASGNTSGSSLDAEGAAVYAAGEFYLANSVVADNVTEASDNTTETSLQVRGGAIRGTDGAIITDGAIYDNVATAEDNTVGTYLHVQGAGVRLSYAGTFEDSAYTSSLVVNTTIAGNALTASGNTVSGDTDLESGGLRFYSGDVAFVNSTVTGNYSDGAGGGGVYAANDGSITLANTILTGNGDASGDGDVVLNSATLYVTAPSIYGTTLFGTSESTELADTAAEVAALIFEETTDFVDLDGDGVQDTGETSLGTGVAGGVVADNGGEVPTVALLTSADNPAVDAGDDSYLDEATVGLDLNGDGDTVDTIATDARGYGRPSDIAGAGNDDTDTVDLGAYELLALVTDGADTFLGTSQTDLVSLEGGDDVFVGLAGDDDFDGGEGTDTAAYLGDYDSFVFSFDGSDLTVTDTDTTELDEGSDTLVNVEVLTFGDGVTADVTTADDGAMTMAATDTDDAYDWGTETHLFTADGALEKLLTDNDDGTLDKVVYDIHGEETWSERGFSYAADLAYTSLYVLDDDGDLREDFYTDGVLSSRLWTDSAGDDTWATKTVKFDTDGAVEKTVFANDDGTSDKVVHDLTDAKSWSERGFSYDADLAYTSLYVLDDDGDLREDFYTDGVLSSRLWTDGAGDDTWATKTVSFDTDGSVLDITYVYDDVF